VEKSKFLIYTTVMNASKGKAFFFTDHPRCHFSAKHCMKFEHILMFIIKKINVLVQQENYGK
jgi:hypothetical protein